MTVRLGSPLERQGRGALEALGGRRPGQAGGVGGLGAWGPAPRPRRPLPGRLDVDLEEAGREAVRPPPWSLGAVFATRPDSRVHAPSLEVWGFLSLVRPAPAPRPCIPIPSPATSKVGLRYFLYNALSDCTPDAE